MKTTYIATIASLIAGQALAVTTWIAQTDTSNSNANWPSIVSTAYSNNFGIAFKTGAAGPFSMDWLTIGLNTSSVSTGSASFKVALRNTTDTTAYSAVAGTTEYAMDLVSFTMPNTIATAFSLELDATELPNITAFAMQANTTYALIIYNPSQNIGMMRRTGYANGTTNDFYTVTNGFTMLDTFRNNTANYSNNASSFPSLAFSFGELSAIPEPGQSVGLASFLASALLLRCRRKPHFPAPKTAR